MKSIPCLIGLVLTVQNARALNPHPRIWLTPTLMNSITAKSTAGDPDWLALKSQADSYRTWTVSSYYATSCPANTICYNGQGVAGSTWYDPMLTLALVYRVTGDTSYAAKAKDILAAMNDPYKNHGGDITPVTQGSGYPARFVLPAMAIGFDWLYDYLDSGTKADTIAAINAYYTWYSTGASPVPYNIGDPYGNYNSGYILGFSLIADATDGDNSQAPAMYAYMRAQFDAMMGMALQPPPVKMLTTSPYLPTGGLYGGAVPEGYNYGTGTNARIWQTILAWKTSGRADLMASYGQWMKNSAKYLLYDLRPNMWQVGDEGDMPGNCTGPLAQEYPLFLSYLLNGTAEGAYAEYLFRNMTASPCFASTYRPSAQGAVLWKDSGRSATNYQSVIGTAYFSPTDGRLFSRSDWTSSGVWMMFNGGSAYFTSHQNFVAGNIEVQRGSDYLVVDAAQWKGMSGQQGNPDIFDRYSQWASTLYFDDGGTYLPSYPGGQAAWGTTATIASRVDSDIAYQLADLGTAYDTRQDLRNPANRTARYYYRSALHFTGTPLLIVQDRFKAKSSSHTKRIQWHLNPITGAPTVSGSLISTVVGTSKVYIKTLLPASPAIVMARDLATSDKTTPLTYNIQVSDSVAGTDLNVLTVIYATASTSNLPTMNTITTDANWVGVQVKDSLPLVAVFAQTVQDNGDNTYTPLRYSSTTFTTTHDGTGKYLIAGLQPGTYSVVQNGVALPGYSTATVGTNGTLAFAASAGAFSVVQGTSTISPCDLNGDGVVNSADVSIAVKQSQEESLKSAPCRTYDPGRQRVCDVVGVQQVIDASNGQVCKLGQ